MQRTNIATPSTSPLIRSAVILIVGFVMMLMPNKVAILIGAALICLAFFDALNIIVLINTTAITPSEEEIQIKYGLIRKVDAHLGFSGIRLVLVNQSWFEKALNIGSLTILSDTQGVRIQYLKQPESIKNLIEEKMGSYTRQPTNG